MDCTPLPYRDNPIRGKPEDSDMPWNKFCSNLYTHTHISGASKSPLWVPRLFHLAIISIHKNLLSVSLMGNLNKVCRFCQGAYEKNTAGRPSSYYRARDTAITPPTIIKVEAIIFPVIRSTPRRKIILNKRVTRQ